MIVSETLEHLIILASKDTLLITKSLFFGQSRYILDTFLWWHLHDSSTLISDSETDDMTLSGQAFS